MNSATIIADSINSFGNRITTFVVEFPRIVNAEILRHRMLSFNSASSRAIPHKRMIDSLINNGFVPHAYQSEHSGMQGTEYLSPDDTIKATEIWNKAKKYAMECAEEMNCLKVTKQLSNRLLEPFQHIKLVITGTEWQNFFALRADIPAEIHLQELAYKMLELYNNSSPKYLKPGQWHLPFGDKIDMDRVNCIIEKESGENPNNLAYYNVFQDEIKVKISTARCARVSYSSFEGKDDYDADIKLHDRLKSMFHMSPFEHCAKAMSENEHMSYVILKKLGDNSSFSEPGWCGNYRGFIQYRKMIQGENRNDERVLNKTSVTV